MAVGLLEGSNWNIFCNNFAKGDGQFFGIAGVCFLKATPEAASTGDTPGNGTFLVSISMRTHLPIVSFDL